MNRRTTVMKTKAASSKVAWARPARGVSLLFALLTLAALALAALAILRSVGTGAMVVGNLGFKQEVTAYADRAAEDAITYLSGVLGGTTLHTNVLGAGYYATAYTNLDPTNRNPGNAARAVVDWDGDDCAGYSVGSFAECLKPRNSVENTDAGKASQYIITRLCSAQLSPTATGNVCSGPLTVSTNTSPVRGELNYSTGRFTAPVLLPYFRIVVRTTGPRSTTSVTETIIHF
jgi:type IV pilus assembly protein PilX